LVDVIIVNFNSNDYLKECVQSALASTVAVNVYVVDNHSTDRSLLLLKEASGSDQRLHIIENTENVGFARANNQVLSMAKNDYILFLNPDCTVRPDTLEGMARVMASHPDAGMAGCLIRNSDGSEQAGSRRYIPTPWRSVVRIFRLSKVFRNHPGYGMFNLDGQPLPDRPVSVEAISGAFMFVRRTAMEKVGPMDEKYFLHCEDLDWCMRFRMSGYTILFVPDIEIIHAKGVCGTDRPVRVEWHKHVGMVRFYRKFFRHQYPAGLMYLVMAMVWARFTLLAALLALKRWVKS
jgi:hypothetical protein